METVEVNKENWSGEKAKVEFGEREGNTQKFRLPDHGEFTLVFKEPVGDAPYVFHGAAVTQDGRTILTGGKFEDDKCWGFSSMGVEREHEHPAVAAALVIFMVV